MTEKEPQISHAYLELVDQLLDEVLSKMEAPNEDSAQYVQETVNRALEQIGISEIGIPIGISQLRLSLGKETDRGCALLAASYIETELGRLLQSVILEDNDLVKEMFTGTGPFATFSSRINMAFLLGLIGRNAKGDLHLIRKIRNDFAHKPEDVHFHRRANPA